MTASDSGRTYQWDAEGRLKSVNDGALALEVYNALGQRVDHTRVAQTSLCEVCD